MKVYTGSGDRGKTSLFSSAKIGSYFRCSGPHGYFTYQSSRRPAIFVATGTGIAPFCSMVRAGITGFTLLHGVKKAQDLYCFSQFKSAAKIYVSCLSEYAQNISDAFKGRVSDYVETSLPPNAYDFYLCGRREMIRDVTLLVDERFPGSYIYTELFY